MKWMGKYKVNSNDVDCNNIVSTSHLFRYIQDAANCAMEEDGPSYIDLYKSGHSFVLSRIRMNIYEPVYSHDDLTVETWASESKGAQFNRCYRILRNGRVVAEAVSTWALCGVTDRHLYRVSDVKLNYRMDEAIELDKPARMRIPAETELHLVGERCVEYADIDINGHMNNTKYPDIIASYLGMSMSGEMITSVCISFKSEAPLGANLKFYSGSSGGVHYIRTLKEGGEVNIEAEVVTQSL